MELVDYLIENIMSLPGIVRWPGIFLIVVFLLRAVGHLLRFRLVSVITNLLYAFIFALVLAQYGNEIASFISDAINSSG